MNQLQSVSSQLRRGVVVVSMLCAMPLLNGCSSSAQFKMSVSVPTPLVEPLPLRISTYYEPELLTYVFEDTLENHGDFRIDMTGSHQLLFDTVFNAMFEKSAQITNFAELAPDMHGLIAPSIEEVQIALPQQTRSDFYEVWIRYKVQLIDKSGKLVHSWPLAAYGKASRSNYSAIGAVATEALHDAAELALRDAAARITFSFAREPVIQSWIAQVTNQS